jgi:predicted permease
VLWDPLPYVGSERLVRIYHAIGQNRWNLSVVDFEAIESQQTQFEGVAAYSSGERTLTSGDVVERVRVRAVTAGWFELLGIRAVQGRTFAAAEGEYGAPSTAVVSWGFWQRYMGEDASVLGRPIRLDGQDFTVIGILPREVGPLEERFDVFPVLQFEPPSRKGPFTLTVIGRTRSGVDAAVAAAELGSINRRIFPIWQSSWPDTQSTWGMMPLDEFVVGRFRTLLLVLLGAVALMLVVASTNAAGLLTARATQRRTELATRVALGASRLRLVRSLVTESVLLACGGAALGLVLAGTAMRAIRAAGPDLLPRAGHIHFDNAVLGFAALLTFGSLVVFGIIPAIQWMGLRSGIGHTLRASGRTATEAASAHKVRRALVASQFAIAVPLLAGAALLAHSFARLQRVDPGFDADHVLTLAVARPAANDGSVADAFWEQLLERVGAVPGVLAAGLNTGRPPREANNINNFDPLDRPTPVGETEPLAVWLVASPGYFEALRIGLVSGRMFDERDRPDMSSTSALVDETWAHNVYPGDDPIGRQLYEGGCKSAECNIVTVVGVVEDVRYLGLDDAQTGAAVGTVYVPPTQWFASSYYLHVRASGEALPLLGAIRAIVHELDPAIPITDIATGHELIDAALAAPRNLAGVVIAFAAVALLLAMIGIYGVMSYFVHEHRKDIGIRLALGGRPAEVLGLVLGRGMKPVLAGTAIGFAIAIGVTRFITRLLFTVSPNDPATLGIVALAMLGTAVAACWLPARHAARLDPAEVLRNE